MPTSLSQLGFTLKFIAKRASISAGSVSSRPIAESKRFSHREGAKNAKKYGFIHEFSRINTN
jgi:hypothetical protein